MMRSSKHLGLGGSLARCPATSRSLCSIRNPSSVPLPLHQGEQSPPPCHLPAKEPEDPRRSTDAREKGLLALLKPCSNMRDLRQIHAQIIQTGFDQHVFVAGRIITFCSVSEDGLMEYAVSVFRQIQRPDGFLWNTMIRGFGRSNRAEEAFLFYRRMRERGEAADNFTFSFLLKICGQLEEVELGKQVHCCALKQGLDSHLHVRNTLIHVYGLFGDMGTARQMFDEVPDPDIVSWNTIIDGYVCCGRYREALRLFLRMQRGGLEPDEATLVVILSACSELGALDFGRWIHHSYILDASARVITVSNSLIDMYAKCGAIDKALGVFQGMEETNLVSWNSMILGLAMHGHADGALGLFSRMQEEEVEEPNDITFLGVLCACSHGGLVEEGRKYFDSMRTEHRISPTVRHYGCMVDLLGRAGLVREAYELTRSMPMECNAVVWRTLLGACRVHGDVELGERVREHLLGFEPDHSGDYVLLSHIYASAGRWNDVLRVREVMRGRGVEKPMPGNSLL